VTGTLRADHEQPPRGLLSNVQGENTNGGVQVIARAAQILRALGKEPAGLTPMLLGERLDLARSTVHRILAALEQEELVASDRGRYFIGPAFDRLAHSAQERFIAEITPYLARLCSEIGETVQLCIRDGDKVLVVAQVPSEQELRVVGTIGSLRPLHATASGKAFLAELANDAVERLLPSVLVGYTPSTQTDLRALERELEEIRTHGVATTREELSVGVCSIGAVVHHGSVGSAAVALPIPSGRFYGREAELSECLRAAIRTIEVALGRA
jgi:DNA-binding IclR family transcriptional regulator